MINMKKIKLNDYYIEYESFPIGEEYEEDANVIYNKPSDISCFCNRILVKKNSEIRKIIIYDDYYNEKENRIVFDDKFLYYLCGSGKLLKISLESLDIVKDIELDDFGTYFNLTLKHNRLVVYGELNVYVSDLKLNIIEHFSAPDVLIEFEINDRIITVKDFNDAYYNIMIK